MIFIFTIGAEFLLLVLGVVTGTILARVLGPVGRGELAAITLWPSLILTLGGLGIPATIAYFVSSTPKESDIIYKNALILALFQSVVLTAVGLLVVPLALKGKFAYVIPLSLIYLISIPLSLVTGIHIGILQGLLRMKQHSLQRILPAMVYMLGLLILFRYGKHSLGNLVLLLLLSLIVSTLLGFGLIWEIISKQFWFKGELIKKILVFGVKTQVANSAQIFNLRLDQLVMLIFLSPENLGDYVVAVALSGVVTPLSNALGIVTLPYVASRGINDQRHHLAVILRMSFLVLPPLSLLLIVSTPWLLPMFFGVSFSPAVFPAQILLAGTVFLGMNHVLAEGLRGINRPSLPAIAETFALVVTVLLLYLLVPRYGITGAAVASATTYAATFSIMVIQLTKHGGLRWRALLPTTADWKMIWKIISFQVWRRGCASNIPDFSDR